MNSQLYSIYLHIPFCRHRCAYCDFNTYSGLEDLIPAYVDALCSEIYWVGQSVGSKLDIHSVFFGGGTPSLLKTDQLDKIILALRENFSWVPDLEVTLEANPGTLDSSYLKEIYQLGINRLSLGMQSANSQDLHVLERQHNLEDVMNAVKWARRAGIDNVSLDLIFGLPYQSLNSWKNSLSYALSLRPYHLSLYSLTIEHGTGMAKWLNKGLISYPDSDLAADMYEYACEQLDKFGFSHYEISNWSWKNIESGDWSCKHNLQYWRSLPYIGLGAGAHGYVDRLRTVTTLTPLGYIKRMRTNPDHLIFPRTPATVSATKSTSEEDISNYMMMGLRLLKEGINQKNFFERYGVSLDQKFGKTISDLQAKKLVEMDEENLKLTPKGYLLGNQVFLEFI